MLNAIGGEKVKMRWHCDKPQRVAKQAESKRERFQSLVYSAATRIYKPSSSTERRVNANVRIYWPLCNWGGLVNTPP